jgi:hypothetical protein
MRKSFGAMFSEMVPHIIFAHRLNAKGGQLKTPIILDKPGQEDDHFWIRRLISGWCMFFFCRSATDNGHSAWKAAAQIPSG